MGGITVRSTSDAIADSVSTLNIARPTGTADWDGLLLVCLKSEFGDPATFALSGFTIMGSVFNGSSIEGKILYRIASGEPSSYTVTTPTATGIVLCMLALSGAHPTPTGINVVDASGSGTSVVAPDIGSGSNPQPGDLVVRTFGAANLGGVTFTTPSGMTEHADAGTGVFASASVCSRVVTAAGAQGTATSTASVSPGFGWTATSLVVAQDPSSPVQRRRGPSYRR